MSAKQNKPLMGKETWWNSYIRLCIFSDKLCQIVTSLALQLLAIRPHPKLFLRLVTLVRKKTTNAVHVLVSEKTTAHLPVCEVNPTRSLHSTLKKYMTDIFG